MKQLLQNYTFNAAAKTVTLTDLTTIRLDRILLIVDATVNTVLYNFADPTVANATVATNIVTLSTVPGNAQNADKLLVYYDTLPGDTPGGLTPYSNSIGATPTAIKSSSGQLNSWSIGNSNTTAIYVQLFDVVSTSVTLGTTAPKFSLYIPSSGGSNIKLEEGIPFTNAITAACTATRTGSTAPANLVDLNFFFK